MLTEDYNKTYGKCSQCVLTYSNVLNVPLENMFNVFSGPLLLIIFFYAYANNNFWISDEDIHCLVTREIHINFLGYLISRSFYNSKFTFLASHIYHNNI